MSGRKKTWDSVKEGLSFVFRTKELLGAVSLDLFAVLFGGAVALIPVYARDILKVGAQGFGLLNGASDMGSVCIVIFLTLFPPRRKQGRKLLLAVAGFGIASLFWYLQIVLVIFWRSPAQRYGWHQRSNARHHYAIKNTGQYAGPRTKCKFHVHQFKQ
jgi:hypothetical protein